METLVLENDSIQIGCSNNFYIKNKPKIIYNGKNSILKDININLNKIKYFFDCGATIEDQINIEDRNLISINRSWSLVRRGEYRLISYFTYDDENLENHVMVPGILYDGNLQGVGLFPSYYESNIWSFCETRMSVPSCAQLYNGKKILSCSILPTIKKETLSSVSYDRHGIRIVIPSNEWPKSYKGKKNLVDTIDDIASSIIVEDQTKIVEKKIFVFNESSRDRYLSYKTLISQLEPFSVSSGNYYSWQTYSVRKFTRLLNLIRKSDDNKAYLVMGEGNGDLQSHYNYTAASFLVKSLEAAFLLTKEKEIIQDVTIEYKKAREKLAKRFNLNDDENLMFAISKLIGEFFLKFEISEGVHQDCYDLERNIFGGYLGIGEHNEFEMQINTRCNGETMLNYVLLYNSLKKENILVPDFINIAKRVARFYCDNQLHNGSFGRWWTKDGRPMDISGTNGVHIAVFLIELLTNIDKENCLYLDIKTALYQAYDYYNKMVYENKFYGDTLDADSVDKEAAVVLLRFFLDLYEIEKNICYLESAKKVVNFLLTWVWQFNSFIESNSPLGERSFSTKGMSSVSVAHNHLDFYGIAISYDLFRLHKYSKDSFYKNQGIIMAKACCQLISNPKDRLDRDPYFDGWQPEQINHTDWDYFNNSQRANGSFYIDIAWVTVLGLSSYYKIKKEFEEYLV
ncbi:MAG: hypothetical protein EOL97_03975 [Spirochaetia bacterium]|nr:hypothetical protein [Spirochaetia bacterium]